MVNYQNGKIYMIESLIGNCRYYGSTTQTLAQRLGKHKQDIKRKYVSSKEVLQYPDFRILLVKKYPCNSVEELEAEEAVYIRNNDCVNKVIPQRTKKEYYNYNKDEILKKAKERYEEKKDEILEKSKVYREEHRDELLEKNKVYYTENRDNLLEYAKKYRDNNKYIIKIKKKNYYKKNLDIIKEKAKEKTTCECSSIVCRSELPRHRKSQKHLKLLEKLTKSPQILS